MSGITAKVASARRQFMRSMMKTNTSSRKASLTIAADAGGEQIVERVHVGGHARDQPPHRAAVVKAHGQALQALEDLLAQVVHRLLADFLHHAHLQVLKGESQRQRRQEQQGHPSQAANGHGGRESRGAARARCSGPRRFRTAWALRRPAARSGWSARPRWRPSPCRGADSRTGGGRGASRRLFLRLLLRESRSCAFQLFLEQLLLIQLLVVAALRQQFLVRAAFDDASLAQDDDLVGMANSGDAMRNQDGGALLHDLLQAGAGCALRCRYPRWRARRPESGFADCAGRRGPARCAASGRRKA